MERTFPVGQFTVFHKAKYDFLALKNPSVKFIQRLCHFPYRNALVEKLENVNNECFSNLKWILFTFGQCWCLDSEPHAC
jgi:hypothetical protein